MTLTPRHAHVRPEGTPMSLTALVSYDDTSSDHDALMLARIFGAFGARPLLVYVRHATLSESAREELEEDEARTLLERGARWLGEWNMPESTRVVVSASTAEGLRRIAGSEGADLIVFGSEHRTAPGHVTPQRSTQILLDGGPAAVAIAPAGYRSDRVPQINTIGVPPMRPTMRRWRRRADSRCTGTRSSSITAAASTCSSSVPGRRRRPDR